MTKKSFFERLTGATEEEVGVGIVKPKDSESKIKEKEEEKEREKEEEEKEGKEKKKEEEKEKEEKKDKEEWPPEEEGQLTIDVYQTENDLVIKSTIAGLKPEDLDVSITNDMITIKGARRQDDSVSQENYYFQELYWGPFSRSVILPVDVDADKARASMKNGILTIKLPKVEKAKIKIIRVKEME